MKYVISVPYSGYSRGDMLIEVQAESASAALVIVRDGEGTEIDRIVCRDDTDKEWSEAEVVND